MEDNMESRIIPILKVLSESQKPLGSTVVSRKLKDLGINLSERSVRYHFLITDIRGLTQSSAHDGRLLTPKGLEELKIASASKSYGFLELNVLKQNFDLGK